MDISDTMFIDKEEEVESSKDDHFVVDHLLIKKKVPPIEIPVDLECFDDEKDVRDELVACLNDGQYDPSTTLERIKSTLPESFIDMYNNWSRRKYEKLFLEKPSDDDDTHKNLQTCDQSQWMTSIIDTWTDSWMANPMAGLSLLSVAKSNFSLDDASSQDRQNPSEIKQQQSANIPCHQNHQYDDENHRSSSPILPGLQQQRQHLALIPERQQLQLTGKPSPLNIKPKVARRRRQQKPFKLMPVRQRNKLGRRLPFPIKVDRRQVHRAVESIPTPSWGTAPTSSLMRRPEDRGDQNSSGFDDIHIHTSILEDTPSRSQMGSSPGRQQSHFYAQSRNHIPEASQSTTMPLTNLSSPGQYNKTEPILSELTYPQQCGGVVDESNPGQGGMMK